MFLTAYDTSACKFNIMEKTTNALLTHLSAGGEQLSMLTDGDSVVKTTNAVIYMVTPGNAAIPLFAHPLVTEDLYKNTVIFGDARNFMRLGMDKKPVIHANMEYSLLKRRVSLQAAWLDKTHFINLLNLGSFPIKIYTRWLTDIITLRLALSPDIQDRVSAITALFYLCLFMPEAVDRVNKGDELTENEIGRMSAMISRSCQLNIDVVIDVLKTVGLMCGLDDYVLALKQHTGSQRFEDFNLPYLFTIVGGTWFGANGRETAWVAIEHPPTWLAILYTAVYEKGFKNAFISKIAQQYQKTDDVKSFVRNMENIFI